MRDINSIAMEVILHAGDGRNLIDQALEAMAAFDFAKAEQLLDEADKLLLKAHVAQTEAIQGQISGEDVEYSLLFVHAQDTIMTIMSEHRMAKKMLPIFKALAEKGHN